MSGRPETSARGRTPTVALLELTPADLESLEIPDGWGPFLSVDGKGLELRGDDTGNSVLYVAMLDDRSLLGLDMGELLDRMDALGVHPSISPEALSFFLHDGQVPYPGTIFQGVSALTIGDRARVTTDGRALAASFSLDFPYFSRLSREDQEPDPDRLLALLTEATVNALAGCRSAKLLLSAGKDSTGLALALAEAGRTDVTCVTYTSEGDNEHVFAADVCRRLGLPHRTVSLDTLGDSVPDLLERFFTESPVPAGDLAQVATVLAVAGDVGDGEVIVEGTGNDVTFGYVPRAKDQLVSRLTIGRWDWADGLKALLSPGSQLNYLLRDPVEIYWTGLRVRFPETRRLLEEPCRTSRRWRAVRRDLGAMDVVDRRGLLRGRHFEIGNQKEKIGLATRALGSRAVHPYQDRRVIDYYFNLPESSRYDREKLVNKVLLRELLHKKLGYDERAIGKRGFCFDGAAFVRRYRTLIRDELFDCKLFTRGAVQKLARSIDNVDRGRYVWHHILGVYQLAAWHNHSRYLRG